MDTELFQFLTSDLPVIAVLAYAWLSERAQVQYHQRREARLLQVIIAMANGLTPDLDLDDDTGIDAPTKQNVA